MKKYVKSSKQENLLGYGVDYVNLNNGTHGILWTPDENTADIIILRVIDDIEYGENGMERQDELIENIHDGNINVLPNIDYDSITSDDWYYRYDTDDGYILLINEVTYNIYL